MSPAKNELILDPEAIANLRLLGDEGDDTFLREILTIYLNDVPQRIRDLKLALEQNDQPFFTRSAHTIKGSSANAGAKELKNLATTLEARSKNEPLAALGPALAELEQAFGRAEAKMRELLT
jgi:HPt (histidine-containing phosphotransfer) domain-containing protein